MAPIHSYLTYAALVATGVGAAPGGGRHSSNPFAIMRRDDIHTRPQMNKAKFDYGDKTPDSLMELLKDNCGDTTCESEFAAKANYPTGGDQGHEERSITIKVDATFDGPDIRDGMIQGIIEFAKQGVEKTTQELAADNCDGSPFGCESGNSIDRYKATNRWVVNRFLGDSAQAGSIDVTFELTDDGGCGDMASISKDVAGAMGAVGPVGAIAGPFFGLILDVICMT